MLLFCLILVLINFLIETSIQHTESECRDLLI